MVLLREVDRAKNAFGDAKITIWRSRHKSLQEPLEIKFERENNMPPKFAKKSESGKEAKKKFVKRPKDPKRYAKTFEIRDGQHPDVIKWKEGLGENLSSEFGLVSRKCWEVITQDW